MRIVFLSPDEPLYLPEFYKYVFDNILSKHKVKVLIVPPIYRNTTRTSMAMRYAKVFGLKEAATLSCKVLYYKGMDVLVGKNGYNFYSLHSVFEKYGIQYLYEQDVNSRQNIAHLKEWRTDLLISVSCPQIFKKELIAIPLMGCLNLHGSKLPDYRGVMPSFWVLANNENKSGITLFFVNEKIDAGDVLIQREYEIYSGDTMDSLIKRSKKIGAEMVVEAIEKINKNDVKTYPLDMNKGRYFGWPTRGDVLRFLGCGRRLR